jgi:hypothetical protein
LVSMGEKLSFALRVKQIEGVSEQDAEGNIWI